jgi:hypothetical protein
MANGDKIVRRQPTAALEVERYRKRQRAGPVGLSSEVSRVAAWTRKSPDASLGLSERTLA